MSNGSIDVAWRALFRAIAVLPVAIVVWIPFLFGFLQIFRPIVEFISRLLSGNIVSGISSAGILEWALKTNLIVADKPDQLYEFAVLPQYFLLPFPLVWAGVWACAPRSKRTLYLGLATAITSMAALLPLLLQIMSAAPFAARSIGLHTMLARDFMGRTVLAPYDPRLCWSYSSRRSLAL